MRLNKVCGHSIMIQQSVFIVKETFLRGILKISLKNATKESFCQLQPFRDFTKVKIILITLGKSFPGNLILGKSSFIELITGRKYAVEEFLPLIYH